MGDLAHCYRSVSPHSCGTLPSLALHGPLFLSTEAGHHSAEPIIYNALDLYREETEAHQLVLT